MAYLAVLIRSDSVHFGIKIVPYQTRSFFDQKKINEKHLIDYKEKRRFSIWFL